MRIKHPQGAPSTNGEHAPQRERQEVTGEEFKRDILPAGWPSRFYVRIGGRIPEGAKPMSDGRLAVHAFDREDENPSAFLRDHGDGVGLYHDSRGRTCSVCDLAADEGLYSSWKDALRDVADHEGVDIGAYHIVASNGAGSSSRNGHQRNGAASHPPPAERANPRRPSLPPAPGWPSTKSTGSRSPFARPKSIGSGDGLRHGASSTSRV